MRFAALLLLVSLIHHSAAFITVPLDAPQRAISFPHCQSIRVSSTSTASSLSNQIHIVDGIECREVPIHIATLGTITILEATADAQEELVNLALLEEEDKDKETKDSSSNSLNEGDPYGAVLWPAASAVADYLLKNELLPHFESTLEVGAGTGLVSMAVARCRNSRVTSVLATDYEAIPLELLKYADAKLNSKTKVQIETGLFDLCDESTALPQADLVVAADIMYEPKTGRAMARRAIEALQRGSRVLVGDSPGRAGRPAFLATLKESGVVNAEFVETVGRTCIGPRHDLICGKESLSVSEMPQELAVAILDLDPARCFNSSSQ